MQSFFKYPLFLAVLVLAISASCKKEEAPKSTTPAEQAIIDDSIIRTYLGNHSIEAIKDTSGVYYSITVVGNGNHPNLNSTVEVKYKGYFTNGAVFDQRTNNSVTLPLNQLIKGWQIGIPYISKGGKAILFVPSALGYGPDDYSGIPGNSVLIFEIELINF